MISHDFLEHLNSADWVCLVILLFSACSGFLRGFSREAVNLGVWVAAGWVSVRGTDFVLVLWPDIGKVVASNTGGNALAHLIVLAVSRAGLNGVANYMSTMGRGIFSNGVDTLLGVVFGLLRGYLLLVLAGLFLSWAASGWLHMFIKHSIFAPYILQGMDTLQGYLPADLAGFLKKSWDSAIALPSGLPGNKGDSPAI